MCQYRSIGWEGGKHLWGEKQPQPPCSLISLGRGGIYRFPLKLPALPAAGLWLSRDKSFLCSYFPQKGEMEVVSLSRALKPPLQARGRH